MPEGSAKTRDLLSRYLSQKIDGNVDLVTWAQAQRLARFLLFMRLSYQRDIPTNL